MADGLLDLTIGALQSRKNVRYKGTESERQSAHKIDAADATEGRLGSRWGALGLVMHSR